MGIKHWQDWVNVILGLWMVASAWVLGFASDSPVAWTAWILGAAIVVFAGIAVYIHKAWEEVLNILLGICLIAAPRAVGFAEQTTPTTNAVVVGLFVTAVGLWAMLKDTAVQNWWHEHHPTR